MGLDEFKEDVVRKVWTNKNGSKVMCVSGILDQRKYGISIERKEDQVTIRCIPKGEE